MEKKKQEGVFLMADPRKPATDRHRHRSLPRSAPAQGAAALHHLRLGRRRQVDADRPAAVRLEDDLRGSAGGAGGGLEARRHAGRRSTSRCWSTAWPPSASRASPSTSPTASSRPTAQVHRRRHAGPRAVHAQHGHRRLDRRSRRDPDRRAQGRADADPPPQLSRVAARHPHVVLAVNKMDLVGYDRRFRRASSRLPRVRRRRSASTTVVAIPISALRGDNITTPRAHALVRRADADASISRRSRSTSDLQSGRRSACRCSGSTGRTSISAASPALIAAARSAPATMRACRRAKRAGRAHRHAGRRSCDEARRRPVGHADAGRRDRRRRGDVLAAADAPPEVADQFEPRSSGWPRAAAARPPLSG
jgi:hypothetical protein